MCRARSIYISQSDIKGIFSSTDATNRTQLQNDFKGSWLRRPPRLQLKNPNPSAGEKLVKDIFKVITFDNPTEQQVKELQESLGALQKV